MTMMTSKMRTQTRIPKLANANEAHSAFDMYVPHWASPSIFHTLNGWINESIAISFYICILNYCQLLLLTCLFHIRSTQRALSYTRLYFMHISPWACVSYLYLFFFHKFLNCFSYQVNPLFNLPAININLTTCPPICWLSDKLRHVIMESWSEGLGWWVDYA